jgi:hypothetical protein
MPSSHQNLMKDCDEIMRKLDAKRPEADAIALELEDSYMSGVRSRKIPIV